MLTIVSDNVKYAIYDPTLSTHAVGIMFVYIPITKPGTPYYINFCLLPPLPFDSELVVYISVLFNIFSVYISVFAWILSRSKEALTQNKLENIVSGYTELLEHLFVLKDLAEKTCSYNIKNSAETFTDNFW